MIRLNLLPDVKREYLRTQQVRVKVITAAFFLSAIAIAATVIMALWVYGAQGLQQTLLTEDIKKSDQQLRSIKDIDKYVTIQNQLASITALHESKNRFSRLFDYLPSINSGVKLGSVAVDSDAKTIIFDGQTDNYTTLIIFRDTLKSALLYDGAACPADLSKIKNKVALFNTVVIDAESASTTQEGQPFVSFKMTAAYTDAAFSATVKSPKICVPKKDTTPSTLGTPNAIFDSVEEAE